MLNYGVAVTLFVTPLKAKLYYCQFRRRKSVTLTFKTNIFWTFASEFLYVYYIHIIVESFLISTLETYIAMH